MNSNGVKPSKMVKLSLCLGILVGMVTGCDEPVYDVACVTTNHLADTIMVDCTDGTATCSFDNGSTRYSNCWYNDKYCVETCK